jgi:hypothetical protein
MTSDHQQYSGYVYSPPAVVDIDRDGKLEMIIGTGLGFIYMINSKGKVFFLPQLRGILE